MRAGLALDLVAVFFVTSSDSGSLVVDMLASGGHPNPPIWSRVLWVSVEGLIAIVLLLAGGLSALQAGAIITALPFSVVMVLIVFALLRALRTDLYALQAAERRERRREFEGELEDNFESVFGPHVDDRIDDKLSPPRVRGGSSGTGRTRVEGAAASGRHARPRSRGRDARPSSCSSCAGGDPPHPVPALDEGRIRTRGPLPDFVEEDL